MAKRTLLLCSENMKRIVIIILLSILVTACSDQQNPSQEEHFQLDNGLSVILRPVNGAKTIALVTIYSIGENYDPEGKSGMAHLIEHLYITAAAGDKESRTIKEFISQYPDGWNGQVGENHTIIATVFAKEHIENELKDAAMRMNQLDVDENDLKQETLRIENELANMYGGVPALAAQNLAAGLVLAHATNTRRGGWIKQIKSISVEQVQKRLKAFYKPQNAILVIAGNIDLKQIKKIIDKNYSKIASGKLIEATPLLQVKTTNLKETKRVTPRFPQAQSHVALAFRTPYPSDKLFPAFLVIAARLQKNSFQLSPPQTVFPVGFALLDRPEVLFLHLPVPVGQKGDATLIKLRNYVSATISSEMKSRDITNAKDHFSYLLGFQQYPDLVLVKNIYGVAFTLGMRKQLGIKSQELLTKLNAVTPFEFSAAAKKYFAPGNCASVIVSVE